MNWKSALIPPLAIYAANFIFISLLIGFKIDQTALWVWIAGIVITTVGLCIATNYLLPKSIKDGLLYGIAWVVVMLALDLILTVRFTGMEYFADWKSYIPYALTILIPTFRAKK